MHFETDARSLDNNSLVFPMLSFVKEPGDVFYNTVKHDRALCNSVNDIQLRLSCLNALYIHFWKRQ